jgi:hypothetical protein
MSPKLLPWENGVMEIYPFHHKNLIFNIITDFDLTFKEIRDILDYLMNAGAFQEEKEEWGQGKIFDIQLDKVLYTLDVVGYELVIYQRREV